MSNPLVSVVLLTMASRVRWIPQCIKMFERQDYEPREMIIVGDAEELAQYTTGNIRYLHEPYATAGAKRNRGCDAAQGRYLAQWDDDDWSGPTRLSEQVAPLIRGQADVTGIEDMVFFNITQWQFWRLAPWGWPMLFVESILGSTVMFNRQVYNSVRFHELNGFEDGPFVRDVANKGFRLERLQGRNQFVYIRHGYNVWDFGPGFGLGADSWRACEPPQELTEDFAFYRRMAA